MADSNDPSVRELMAALKEEKDRNQKAIAAAVAAAVKEEKERNQKARAALLNGTFFTPIDQVWAPETSTMYKGAFARMCRTDKYYEKVDEYGNIVREVRGQAAAKAARAGTSSRDRVAEDLAESAREGGGSEGRSAVSEPKKGRRGKSKRIQTNANNSPRSSNNDDDPSDVSDTGSEPSLGLSATAGSNISTGSGLEIPDCFGRRPSSRAHMVPDSDCYTSYGVI
jgi:hypothetical protein